MGKSLEFPEEPFIYEGMQYRFQLQFRIGLFGFGEHGKNDVTMHSIIKSKPHLFDEAGSSLGVAPYGEAEPAETTSRVLKMLCIVVMNDDLGELLFKERDYFYRFGRDLSTAAP